MIPLIQERLKNYSPQSAEEELDAIKEIVQEIVLYGLSTSHFFKKALFQGGTALRILYGLPRFSEDLDFILKEPELNFNWTPYIENIKIICEEYGLIPNIIDKSNVSSNVKKMFIKDNSFGKILDLSFNRHSEQKITIKFEVDVFPPAGSISEIKYLDFPLNYAVEAQDLSSNFAGKSHALLCRKYLKGRDWFDFVWYISKRVKPNLIFLKNALYQTGPWEGQNVEVTPDWYLTTFTEKINHINWLQAKSDVEMFLNQKEREQLSLWGKEFFLDRLEKLGSLF